MARQTRKGRGSKGFATKWKKAAEERGESLGDAVPLEPGTYEMQLCKATVDDYESGRKVMLKFVVIDPEDCAGAICTYWEGVDSDERLIWLQRLMISLGIDLDSVEIESEDDLLAAFQEIIDEGCACKVRVTEKDGYTNMRVLKAIEVDNLLDPEDALKGNAAPKDDDSDDDDDVNKDPEPDDGDEEVTKDDLEVGMQVECMVDGSTVDAEVTSLPPRGKKVQVRPEGEEDVVLIDVSDITAVYEDQAEDGADDDDDDSNKDDDSGEDDDNLEIEVGDWVTYKKGRVKIEAEVIEIDGDEAKVKPENGKAVTKNIDDLELMLED